MQILAFIRSLARQFVGTRTDKVFGLLGFSNGGYFASRVWLDGLSSSFGFVVAWGCGVDDKLGLPSKQVPLWLICGEQDVHHIGLAKQAWTKLKNTGVGCNLRQIDGDHRLIYSPLVEVLTNVNSK